MTETFFTIISLFSFNAEGVNAKQALGRYGNFSSIEKCNLYLEKQFAEKFIYKQTQGEKKELLTYSHKDENGFERHFACVKIEVNEELFDFSLR